VILNMAYALLYEQTLAYWAVHAGPDRHGHMPDPLDLLDEAVG
jgi:hypothetical protein